MARSLYLLPALLLCLLGGLLDHKTQAIAFSVILVLLICVEVYKKYENL
jgi:hypothetical protein